jgi:hypothetical protein
MSVSEQLFSMQGRVAATKPGDLQRQAISVLVQLSSAKALVMQLSCGMNNQSLIRIEIKFFVSISLL